MSSPSQVAAGFTITGLLDGASRTRGRYPVSEIAVADIADHPANAAYSMDPAGIAELAESIRADGLTDLPLVRKVGDGSWQMVSGHRRKAAYALLAKDDPAYERMPCRVIEGIDDERAVTLLHAANYFTRALTVTERAAATEALRGDAVRLRSEIAPCSLIVHDKEKAHKSPVKAAKCTDEAYKADAKDPAYLEAMELVNNLCSWLRRYLFRFPGMKKDNLQSYLNWFVYLFRIRRDEEKWPKTARVMRHLLMTDAHYRSSR